MKKILLFTIISLIAAMLCVGISANDHYVFGVADIFGHAGGGGGVAVASDIVKANNTSYISATATGQVSNGGDGTQLQLNIKDMANSDFKLKDYPVMKIVYASDVKSDAVIDFNIGLNYNGTSTRLWGYTSKYDKTGKPAELIVDISKKFTGGENLGGAYSWDNVDDDSPVNYVRIKYYYQGKQMIKDEYFNVEYVGFFKTEEDAKKYKHDGSSKIDLRGLELNFKAIRKNVGESFELVGLPNPSFAELSNVTFTSENTSVATVDSKGNVNVVGAGDTYIVAKSAGFEAKCHVYAFAEPLPAVKFVPKSIVTDANVVVNALGDSITTYAPSPDGGMNYHDWWARDYYVENNDYGISGASLTSNGANPFVDRYVKMVDDADLIVVKGGTNDFGKTAVGDINDRTTTTYTGSLRYLMEGLIEKYPDKQIVFLTVIKRCEGGQTPATKNGFGDTLNDYADTVVMLGELYGIPTVQLYTPEELDFTGNLISKSGHDENGKWHDAKTDNDNMPDGLHPSGKGHRILADYILNELVEKGVIEIDNDAEDMSGIEVTDYKIFKASELATAATAHNLAVANEVVKEDGTEYVNVTNGKYTESIDSTYVSFDLKKLGADFLIKDYPYVKIGYKTNISQRINSDLLLKRDGKYSRHWGVAPAYVKDGTAQDITFSLAQAIGGAQVAGYSTFDDIDDDSSINEFWFKPWGGHTLAAMTSDHYFKVEYIAFFKSSVEAMMFDYGVTPEPIVKGSGFTDTLTHWGCDAIDYAVSRGLFNGVTETTFAPNGTMTRGMLVTVLSRLGKDTANTTAYPYKDVASNAWFAPGVSFAYANKIVDSGDMFRPDDNITREELADMLYRYAKNTGKNVELAELTFTDAASIANKDAVAYCVNAGIIKGYDDNTFKPSNSATRAEVATMIQRFVNAK
ncbi:MAG: S-layer homology domain-containing protein [Clostridia bacterium]|nr:S-layer homology domain-containing protein [Clostridia bacterium]